MPVRNTPYRERSVLAAACFLATLLAISAGCGSSEYSAQMEKRMAELQQVSAFAALYKDPTDDLPVNLRVPTSMTKAYDLYSVDPIDSSKRVASDRALPPFMLDGVGFRRSFEGAYEPSVNNSMPYFLYVWEFDAPRPKDGLANLRDLVRFKMHDEKADWEPVEVKTPEGTTLTWQRLHVKGDQTFEVKRNGQILDDTSPGVFELWAFETPGWDVLLGWRASDEAWDKAMSGYSKLSELPPIVAGTIRFAPDQQRNKKPVPAIGKGLFVPRPLGKSPAPDAPAPTNGATAPTDATPPNNVQANAASNGNPPANNRANPPSEVAAEPQSGVKFVTREYMTDDDGSFAFSAPFPEGWEQEGSGAIHFDPESGATYWFVLFETYRAKSAREQEVVGTIKQLLEYGIEEGKGSIEMGHQRGEYQILREQLKSNMKELIEGFYFVHFGDHVVAMSTRVAAPAYPTIAAEIKKSIDGFRREPIAIGGQAGSPASLESGRTYIGAGGSPDAHCFSFRFPDGWKQKAMAAMAADGDPRLTDSMKIEVREVPESVPLEQILTTDATNRAALDAKMGSFRTTAQGQISFDGFAGQFRILDCTTKLDSRQRKMIFYVLRHGTLVSILSGNFDANSFDATKQLFDGFAKSVRIEKDGTLPALPSPGAASQDTPAELQPSAVSGIVQGNHFSLRLPAGWKLNDASANPNQAMVAAKPESQQLGAEIWLGIGVSKFSAAESPDQYIESQIDNVKKSFFDDTQVIDSGKISVEGKEGPYKVVSGVQKRTGEKLVWGYYVARIGDDQLTVWLVNYPTAKYESVKTIFKQSVESFHLDNNAPNAAIDGRTARGSRRPPPPVADASGPNAAKPAEAAAAPPAKEGPAEIEFGEGVTGSITFPAGFQHEGKAPQASTPPPMPVDPAAAGQQPNTIKIEVKKLGQGVNYIDLHKEALTSEIQNAVDGKVERGNCTIAGVTGDFIVISVGQSGGLAREPAPKADNEATRKRIVYIANVAPKHLAVKITAEMNEADFKTLKEEMKKCVRSLKFD